jgi:hypothetical protein
VNFALRSEYTDPHGIAGPGNTAGLLPFSLSLKQDKQTRSLPLVTNLTGTETIAAGFGSLSNDPVLGPTVHLVPGSEVVQVIDASGQPHTFQRAGWVGTGQDQIVAQADLAPDQYAIDYSTGLISFSLRDPSLANAGVDIRYQMQTNLSSDLVRVSYATRELFTVSVGVLQFEPGSTNAQQVQLTQQLHLRNLSH